MKRKESCKEDCQLNDDSCADESHNKAPKDHFVEAHEKRTKSKENYTFINITYLHIHLAQNFSQVDLLNNVGPVN